MAHFTCMLCGDKYFNNLNLFFHQFVVVILEVKVVKLALAGILCESECSWAEAPIC